MVRRWILYAACLTGGIIFYFAYRQWFSWFALMAILCLPVAALVLSLPAMTGLRVTWPGSRMLRMESRENVELELHSKWPAPLIRCSMEVTRPITGERWILKAGQALPTQHCGTLQLRPYKLYVYDYLGLFRLKLRRVSGVDVTVMPKLVPVENVPTLMPSISRAWKPKPGGGFSENHEMRLYRPGDKLNQVHWKLSSKVGKLMVREAMEPVRDVVRVEMVIRGKPEDLDRDFGRLLWVSSWLLASQVPHELRVLAGEGTVSLSVSNADTQREAMRTVLALSPAEEGAELEALRAAWQYRIGGGADG